MASIFQDSVAQALSEQPAWARRKDSLTAGAGTILQLGNLLVAFTSDAPTWVNILIGALIGVAQIVVHAGTKGAITPSMVQRLEKAGQEAHLDRVSVSGVITPEVEVIPAPYVGQHRADDAVGLPVYDGPTTGE